MSQIEYTLRMATLEAKEKELRTIVTDGFSRMDQKFAEHEDQIDTLAIEVQNLRTEMNQRFDRVDHRFDQMDYRFLKIENRLNSMDPKLDLILNALAINV